MMNNIHTGITTLGLNARMPRALKAFTGLVALLIICISSSNSAYAVSAFFLSDISKKLTYENSVMVVSRDENRTVITLAPHYKYDGQALGILIPVPNLVSKTQIRFGSAELVEKIVDYTAPRIVPYQELDLCKSADQQIERKLLIDKIGFSKGVAQPEVLNADALQIDLIKAEDFSETSVASFLHDKGFEVNKLQEPILKTYQDAGVEFILVSYNGGDADKGAIIPPIQIAYESGNFILPLGLSSDVGAAAQDLTLIMLSREGLVVPKSLPVKPIGTGLDLPFYAVSEFEQSYQAIFDQALTSDNFQSMFLEYSGDVNWCPNCDLTKKLSAESLRALGVWWLDSPKKTAKKGLPQPKADINNVYVTRLHLRHTDKTIFGKVTFEAKQDKSRFVVSYNAYKPYLKTPSCELGRLYKQGRPAQYHREIQNFNKLTNVPVKEIKEKMEAHGQSFDVLKSTEESLWWERMWAIEGSK
jgi:hypothetical protein